MSWGYGYRQYETVAERKAKAANRLEKLRKANPLVAPILITGRTIARTWWAKSWNDNLESYADFSNRIDRGKSYLKSDMVLDLAIEEGLVNAQVLGSGSKLYHVIVSIDKLPEKKWHQIVEECGRQISSTAELAAGVFPKEFGARFLDQRNGLFPSPQEIHFSCTCPDWAYMCKHVAAVLYGIGARFDEDPLLFFKLRGIPYEGLLKESVESNIAQLLANADNTSPRILTDIDIEGIFGL